MNTPEPTKEEIQYAYDKTVRELFWHARWGDCDMENLPAKALDELARNHELNRLQKEAIKKP